MKKLLLLGGALIGLGGIASAQVFTMPPPAGVLVNGCVFNTSPPTLSNTNTGIVQCDSLGRFLMTPSVPAAGTAGAGFPAGATPITGNGTGSTGAVVGTLAAAATKFTYICGFNVSAIGGTAAIGPVTVAGLTGSSQVYQLTSTAAGVQLSQSFAPCIPSSAVNTAITVTTTADGTATAVDVNSWGFQQ
jgi:hypothetical protein